MSGLDYTGGFALVASVWRAAELDFQGPSGVVNAYTDVEMDVEFSGPGAKTIRRPAFWDGDRSWKVRFAPTAAGVWRYSTSSSASELDGLAGDLLAVTDAEAGPAIYRQGFLTKAASGRHLAHADGTAFFWLGDTHWRFAYESWDTANKPGWTSQSRGMVDRRVEQGFTVYQSNLLMVDWSSGRSPYWVDGRAFEELDVAFLRDHVDPRMEYIAASGLVHALGLGWYDIIDGNVDGVARFARYIVARYGAYPMVWTLGGEVAGYDPALRGARIDGWREVALAIQDADGYDHPRTAHATTERPIAPDYQGEGWLTFTLNQHGHGDFDMSADHYGRYFADHPGTPLVEGESMYEGLISVEYVGRRPVTDTMVRHVAYRAVQSGCAGYSYGAQGCWNAAWERDQGATMWGDMPWYEGIDLPGAAQLGHLRRFYEAVGWERLVPVRNCFGSENVFNTAIYPPLVTADPERTTMVAFLGETYRSSGGDAWLLVPSDRSYRVEWFDTRDGLLLLAAGDVRPIAGKLPMPDKPDERDWVLLVRAVPREEDT